MEWLSPGTLDPVGALRDGECHCVLAPGTLSEDAKNELSFGSN